MIGETSLGGTGEVVLKDDSPLVVAEEYLKRNRATSEGISTLVWWRDEFYEWSERAGYKQISKTELRNDIWLSLPKIKAYRYQNAKRISKYLAPNPPMVSAVYEAIQALVSISGVTAPKWLDNHRPNPKNLVSFTNGILDLQEFTKTRNPLLIPPTPLFFSTNTLPISFDPLAKCPRWTQFLDETLDADKQRIALLQEWFGYNLITSTAHQKLMFFVGPPGSGKGTTCRTLTRIVGDDNVATPTLDRLGAEFGLKGLLNKTSAIVADAHIGMKTDSLHVLNTVLAITGEDRVDVSRKHLDPLVGVTLQCRFTIGLNRMPHLPDASNAILRRLLICPFTGSFADSEDITLDGKLAKETAGIINWAIEGLARLNEVGKFTVCKAASRHVNEFRRQNSSVQAFIEDRIIIGEALESEVDAVFEDWKRWCSANDVKPMNKASFGTALSAAVRTPLDKRRLGPRGFRKHYYVGIGIRAIDDDDLDGEESEIPLF